MGKRVRDLRVGDLRPYPASLSRGPSPSGRWPASLARRGQPPEPASKVKPATHSDRW